MELELEKNEKPRKKYSPEFLVTIVFESCLKAIEIYKEEKNNSETILQFFVRKSLKRSRKYSDALLKIKFAFMKLDESKSKFVPKVVIDTLKDFVTIPNIFESVFKMVGESGNEFALLSKTSKKSLCQQKKIRELIHELMLLVHYSEPKFLVAFELKEDTLIH